MGGQSLSGPGVVGGGGGCHSKFTINPEPAPAFPISFTLLIVICRGDGSAMRYFHACCPLRALSYSLFLSFYCLSPLIYFFPCISFHFISVLLSFGTIQEAIYLSTCACVLPLPMSRCLCVCVCVCACAVCALSAVCALCVCVCVCVCVCGCTCVHMCGRVQ